MSPWCWYSQDSGCESMAHSRDVASTAFWKVLTISSQTHLSTLLFGFFMHNDFLSFSILFPFLSLNALLLMSPFPRVSTSHFLTMFFTPLRHDKVRKLFSSPHNTDTCFLAYFLAMAREVGLRLSVFVNSAEFIFAQFCKQDSGGWFVTFSEGLLARKGEVTSLVW